MVKTVLETMRVPLGSLVIDIGLVMMMVYSAGQVVTRLESLDRRVSSLEVIGSPAVMPRIASIEARLQIAERDRQEMLEALRRIEAKIDTKTDKR